MILVVGASGNLGGAVARMLLAAGEPVRAMSRVPARLEPLRALGAEVVAGDLVNADSIARACDGADRVLAAAHAFLGTGANDMARVDDAGNRALVDAARAAGVRHFVFTSACHGPDDPVDFFRTKYAVEQHLRASGLPFTILRPGAFMEVHAELIGASVMRRGWTVILGRGDRPANYVAVADVARVAASVLCGPPRDDVVVVAGPENLTPLEIAHAYARVAGRTARILRVPPGVLRAARAVVGPALPVARRIIDAALLTDTGRQQLDTAATSARFAAEPTPLEEFVRRRHESGAYRRAGRS